MTSELRQLNTDDEHRHDSSDHPAWDESWLFDVVHEPLRLGATFELVLRPHARRAGVRVGVVGVERKLVTLAEEQAALPGGAGLEVRSSGLWIDVGIQTPMDHVTIDLEAFAVELDDEDDVFRGGYGHRIPLGCELEWERAERLEVGSNLESYALPCHVHGELLIGDESIEIDGWGWRSHRWGIPDAHEVSALRGRHKDGSWFIDRDHVIGEHDIIGSAPIETSLGDDLVRRDQRLVTTPAGDIAWQRFRRL